MATPTTPDEWLPVLAKRLDDRAPRIQRLRSYANGNAPLPEMRQNLKASWKAFQKKSRTNFGGLAVETVSSRMIPLGVRVGDKDDTPAVVAARRIWRDNRMRQQIRSAIRDRLETSVGYLVAGRDATGRAVITREKPEDFIADPDPLHPWKARAAQKVWRDETFEEDFCYVWAEGQRQRYKRPSKDNGEFRTVASGGWVADGDPEDYEGAPPVVILERQDGVALFEPHTDLIDRINLGKLQRLVTTAMQAFKQRAIRPKDKESGGLPEKDEDGNDIDWASALEPAPGALWDFPIPIDIWESKETDIRPLLEGEKTDARDFAAVLRLPIAVFTPEGANQSATGADVTKEGLVSTAEDEISAITSGVEVAIVYALRIENVDIGDATVEVLWEPAAWVSITEKYAAAASAVGVGRSRRGIFRDILGMSPDQIRQEEADLAAEQMAALTLVTAAGDSNTMSAEQSADVKARADAMGVLIRSGVTPEDAARQVGFTDMTFTGAVPVTLRVPESDASQLEDK